MTFAERAAALVRSHRRAFVVILASFAIIAWTAVGASAWWLTDVLVGLPNGRDVREIASMAQATTLYDRYGRPAFTIFKEQRIPVPLDRISPHLVRAIVSVEDQRFFEHGGLDVVRVAGAFLSNVRSGRTTQGGSTLTQQLARQSFLNSEKTYSRKMKEVLVAARIEREFDKREILRLYLNKVYFGDGLYGAEAASLGYFGKPAAELTLSEAALLAGLVKSPSAYAPTVDLNRSLARRKIVLQAMRDTGAIDQAAFDAAVAAPVRLNDALRRQEPFGQYFKEEVRKQLVEHFGWERVYEGGLKVHTTIDIDLQKSAEAEVLHGLEDIEKRQLRRQNAPASLEPLQASLVAMDPRSGEVRAMVGGRDFRGSRFNRVTQARRQAGSTFKPFVYAAALEQGFSPGTVLTDLDDPVWTPQGEWIPDDGHSFQSSMTIRAALKTSSNRAAVRMLREVTIPIAVTYADRLGVGPVPGVPSLALGSGEVTLMSMAAAFAAFANEGFVPAPLLIERVEDSSGRVLFTSERTSRRALRPETAYLMSNMLADVITSGTAWSARSDGFALPAAGKTGTTNDYRDAWFVGYTPHIVTGVWVGYDKPRTIMSRGYAAQLAVPIWARFMKTATKNDEPEWFKRPAGVSSVAICRLSGARARQACYDDLVIDDAGNYIRANVYTEYFVQGTEPAALCPIHGVQEGKSFWRMLVGGGGDRRPATPRDNNPRPAAPRADPGAAREKPREVVAERPAEDNRVTATVTAEPVRPPDVAAEAVTPPAAAPVVRERKKRGFWGRLFGGGSGDKRSPQPATPRTR